jgi:hypothetical protein
MIQYEEKRVSHVDGREQANTETFNRIVAAEPVLVDIRPAIEVVPDMTCDTVLTSGTPKAWEAYTGGQRNAVIGGALFQGLAPDYQAADAGFRQGTIRVHTCDQHACVGSVAGIFTASMPVFVVENRRFGNRAFCNLYEGPSHRRLNYGVYDEEVKQNLLFVQEPIAGVLAEAVRASGGIELLPIMRRALHMGDELHSRNTAATLLFLRELFPHLLSVAERRPQDVRTLIEWLQDSDYFFLRLSMAAAKATLNGAHGMQGSSVVTGMTMDCEGFAIRVGGLGDQWFRGPHATVDAKLFEGYTRDDIDWIGGESQNVEATGLGGFAQAAAFPLQAYQGGSPDAMVRMNLDMYPITVGENPRFQIPYLAYRGTPTGIDVHKVIDTGITPVMDVGLAGKNGGQIGAGTIRAPIACFQAASEAYEQRYAAGVSA